MNDATATGCRFADRCPAVMDVCRRQAPELHRSEERRAIACHLQDTTPTLPAGASVRTGRNGWVELRLDDGSTVTLANDTELELTSLTMGKGKKEGLLNLAQGKLRTQLWWHYA